MRIELIYSPGCTRYKKLLNRLELVIAEERLPLPIEVVEENSAEETPFIRIDGEDVESSEVLSCLEKMRAVVTDKWTSITAGGVTTDTTI
ncbi:MAG: hypothetical protein K2X93_08675 [Candidatus Obscuribacterales bacterium]|nr:hypothetical protein [Candidatus Obscuribacterales bacterium]